MASIEGLTGGMPMLNWDSADLPGAYKSFETHCRFMFEGPLKAKSEAEKCAYLMIWLGNKERTYLCDHTNVELVKINLTRVT